VLVLLVPVLALSMLGIVHAMTGDPPAPPKASGARIALPTGTPLATLTPSATPIRRTPTPSPTHRATLSRTSNGCTITAAETSAEQSLLALLNQHRAAAGVRPLVLSAAISQASRQHSCDMFLHQQLSHTGSDGSTPLQRIQATGVSYTTWGENAGTARGQGLWGGILQIDTGMMSEQMIPYDHRWNILNQAFTHVGLGIIYANGQVWMTEDFVG
jgi:uncharacterized protein YkwD